MAAIDRFNEWHFSPDGRDFWAAQIRRFNTGNRDLIVNLLRDEYNKMCNWIEMKNPKYSKWRRFATHWINEWSNRRARDMEKAAHPATMTADQEEDHYARKRVGDTPSDGELKSIGEVVGRYVDVDMVNYVPSTGQVLPPKTLERFKRACKEYVEVRFIERSES